MDNIGEGKFVRVCVCLYYSSYICVVCVWIHLVVCLSEITHASQHGLIVIKGGGGERGREGRGRERERERG